MAAQDISKIVVSLHPLERKVVPHLGNGKTEKDLMQASKLTHVEVVRAIQWLSNKNILKIESTEKETLDLDLNGQKYHKSGLPEKVFLKTLQNKKLTLDELAKASNLDKNEINICIGLLKRTGAIIIDKTPKGLAVSLTEIGEKQSKTISKEEQLLEKIAKYHPDASTLTKEEKETLNELTKRKQIIKKNIQKIKTITLTSLGEQLAKTKIKDIKVIDRLTPDLIKDGAWKKQTFRPYDTKINVPGITGGKRHFVNQALEYIRQIWLDLGFEEMSGDMVQTSYWNLDALYIPQDHPARQMQDTFYLGKTKPTLGDLPKAYKKVKDVHEHGGDTGSLGWRAPWSLEEAQKLLLRTHTTALSAQKVAFLKENKQKIPGKFFNVGKVFRNEALDWCHLFEFYQIDGIVVDPNANLKHLKGYLKEFFGKMGFPKVRMRPAHFPYTEPSMEVDVFHPVKKTWIELGGSGIFRPEVVKPLLGEDVPVLAWGLGLGRVLSEYYGITDLRDLYKNDLKQMKNMKAWMKW